MTKTNIKKVREDKEDHKCSKCSKCGTEELILKGAHWDELHIPAGFFCPNCKYLSYTVWGGYGTGAPEGKYVNDSDIKLLDLVKIN